MSSILTNISSMAALETLRGINRSLEAVQAEISSGKKVASAKDNAAVWAVSAVMSSDVASFRTISESLTLGSATVGVARSVAEKIVATLQDIKSLIVQAQDESVDREKYQTDIGQKTELVQSYVDAAQFNGLNLLDGSQPAATAIKVLASLNRTVDALGDPIVVASNIDIFPTNLSTIDNTGSGGELGGLNDLANIDVTVDPAQALTDIEGMMQTAIDAAAAFGSVQNRIAGQNEFVKTLVDAMNTGIGALTDSDMEAASARLQALQVQQQLGVQSLSIANQAPQALLSLFRQ